MPAPARAEGANAPTPDVVTLDAPVAGDREAHPVAGRYRLYDEAEMRDMVADIRDHGLLVPILLHPDGRIIDGRNRYRACMLAGVPPRFETWDGKGSLTLLAWSLNGQRRHLTPNELAMIGAEIAAELEVDARGRQGARTDLRANLPESSVPRPREQAAAAVGVSPRTVEHARTVIKHGAPELVEAVNRGGASVSAAAAVAKLPKEEQREVVARGEDEILKKAQSIKLEKTLARLPEDERPAARALVEQPGIPATKAVEMVGNLAAKPTEERVRIYSLSSSPKDHERDLALTEAANMPAMPHPAAQQLNMAMQYLREAHRRADGQARHTIAQMIDLGRLAIDQSKAAA